MRETWNPEEIREAIRFSNQHLDGLSPLIRRDLIRPLGAKVEFGRTTMGVTLNAGGPLPASKRRMEASSTRGLCNGGRPILGYDRDPQNKAKRITNDAEAALVRRIFETYLETGSIRATTDAINAAGGRTKSYLSFGGQARGGQLFVSNSIHGILTSSVYIGKREVNKQNKNKEQASFKESERYQVVSATWEPVVDERLFGMVQSKISENRELVKYDQWKTFPFIFTKRMRCLDCGAEVRTDSGHGRSKKYSYYRHVGKCPSGWESVHAEELEQMILHRLEKLENIPQLIEALVKAHHKKVASGVPALEMERTAKQNELKQVQQKIDGLIDRIASLSKDIDASLLVNRVNEFQTQKAQLADNILRLDLEIDSVLRGRVEPEQVRNVIRIVNTNLKGLSAPLKKDLIRKLIHTVEFGKDSCGVTLNPAGLNKNLRSTGSSQSWDRGSAVAHGGDGSFVVQIGVGKGN